KATSKLVTICFLRETTPCNKARFFTNETVNACSTFLLLLPNAKASELLSKLSVTTSKYKSSPFASIIFSIAASYSACLANTASVSATLICAISTFDPFIVNSFASMPSNSSTVLSSKSVPAFNMFKPYSSRSNLAMSAKTSAASLSCAVHVGDLNNKVSEIIAETIKMAFSLEILTSFSLKILYKIVDVQPTGSARKYSGLFVSKFAILWWSITSAIVTSLILSTDCWNSLWSTKITCSTSSATL